MQVVVLQRGGDPRPGQLGTGFAVRRQHRAQACRVLGAQRGRRPLVLEHVDGPCERGRQHLGPQVADAERDEVVDVRLGQPLQGAVRREVLGHPRRRRAAAVHDARDPTAVREQDECALDVDRQRAGHPGQVVVGQEREQPHLVARAVAGGLEPHRALVGLEPQHRRPRPRVRLGPGAHGQAVLRQHVLAPREGVVEPRAARPAARGGCVHPGIVPEVRACLQA